VKKILTSVTLHQLVAVLLIERLADAARAVVQPLQVEVHVEVLGGGAASGLNGLRTG
jgi:hypothetical protein